MSRASKLVLVPTIQAYPEYASWWKARGIEAQTPGPPNIGIFVALGGELISGACVYVMDGPYCMIEHFSVNPKFLRARGSYKPKGSRKAHRFSVWSAACERTLREFRTTAVMLSKFPVISVDRKSLAKVCIKCGFSFTGSRFMAAPMVSA